MLPFNLSKQLELSEINVVTSRLRALQQISNNELGVNITQFGNATAFSINGIPGPAYNTVKGLTDAEEHLLDDIFLHYAAKNIPIQLEIVPGHVTSRLLSKLSNYGVSHKDFHTTLFSSGLRPTNHKFNSHVNITELTVEQFHLYGEIYVKAFNMPTSFKEAVSRNNIILHGLEGWKFYLATMEEKPVGVGVLHIQDHIATLAVAATLPEKRDKGIHTSLINERIYDALGNGAQLICGQAKFGSVSHYNMHKLGLQVAYTKALWS